MKTSSPRTLVLRLALSAQLFALSFLVACAKRETSVQAGIRTQTLHVNNGAEVRDFDPQTTSLPADINVIRALMEGLVEIDPMDCHPIPGVAERWETSADGLTWTFRLRADARWSNGDRVTAGDFVFAYRRILSPALGAEYREQFFCLEHAEEFAKGKIADFSAVGVRAADDRTLVLALRHPTPYLPTLLSQCWWFPLHRATIEKFGKIDQRATPWTRPGNHIGNGAFVLKQWVPGQSVRVARSDTYWDRDRVRLREVVFYPMANLGVGDAAFRAGQLHVTGVPIDKAAAYRDEARMAAMLHQAPLLATALLRVNCRVTPLNDLRVRRALSLAIDREQLARRVVHCDQAAFSFTPPGCAGYTAERSLRTDVAEARRLLAAAGFPEGRGFPRLEMLFFVFRGAEEPLVETIQQMWRRELGINVALAKQEMVSIQAARRSGDYQLISIHWTGDYLDPLTFLELLQSGNANNGTGWASREYDRLLEEAAAQPDQIRRYELLRRAESLMLSEVPFIPLYHQPLNTLRHPAVRGWHDNLLDLHPLKFVYLER